MSEINFDSNMTKNKKMQDLILLAKRTAESRSGVLITGAHGTGKSAMAHWIHRINRPQTPILSAHLSDLTISQFQDILKQVGFGTLVLEGIDQASCEIQSHIAKVLSCLDEDRSPRIIGTSCREVRSLVRQEQIRQDLYYKISVLTLDIPSLEDRPEDIADLAKFYMDVHSFLHGKVGLKLTESAMRKLSLWNWPGNIRELENVIERAVTICSQGLVDEDSVQFDSHPHEISRDLGPGMSLSEVERRLILQTLEMTSQNRTKAAQILGISIRTLRNKLNEYRGAEAI